MSVQLRVVLDQASQIVDADQAAAGLSLTAGLIATAPRGCAVSALIPRGAELRVKGVEDVRTLPLARAELAAAWQLGVTAGVGGGLIHAPTLMAPLARHDRSNDNDQITVALWDLRAWERPESMPKSQVVWQRGMLKRAVRHADAVVVPSHAMGRRLAELARLGDRIRVIAGAAPDGFRSPDDASSRRQNLRLPERYVVVSGDSESLAAGFRAAAQAGVDAVVLDVPPGREPALADAASAAGLPEHRAHLRGELAIDDRAAVLGGAAAFVATSAENAWPWRAVEAMTLGLPLVAVTSGVHQDVIADGGAVVDAKDVAAAVSDALGAGESRLRVLAADRSRAFSWASSAERLWALHAEL